MCINARQFGTQFRLPSFNNNYMHYAHCLQVRRSLTMTNGRCQLPSDMVIIYRYAVFNLQAVYCCKRSRDDAVWGGGGNKFAEYPR